MQIVENWRKAWRWFSTQIFALLAVIPLVWEGLPYDVKEYVPYEARPWLLGLLAVIGLISRLVKQPDV